MAIVMVMWSTLSSHSADATFRRPNEFFSVALFAKNVAIDLKCIETMEVNLGKLHKLAQQAASGAPSEIVKESFALLRERTLLSLGLSL